ncbi:MAG: DNA-processing protein DprA [Pseudomonadota bacterium]
MTEDKSSSTHPPLPPTSEDQRFLWLRLLRSRRVGPTTFHRMMKDHGDAARALEALPGIAAEAGVTDYRPCPEPVVRKELSLARDAGAQLLAIGSEHYPAQLASLDDAPPLLWAVGDLRLANAPSLAIVGARNASSLGTRVAGDLAQELGSAGWCIVSGLARGVDTAAHLAALKTGTIAVQAGGVDVLYPVQNAQLFENIGSTGLRLSEDPMGMAPTARHFPKRNRIISGLSQATIVIEAAIKSGSLITARAALDQGREVLAVPGHPFDARAGGCNLLIRDGARLVRQARDVLDAVGSPDAAQPQLNLVHGKSPPQKKPTKDQPSRDLRAAAELHQVILDRLSPAPLPEDALARAVPSGLGDLSEALTELELQGRVARQAGGLLARSER